MVTCHACFSHDSVQLLLLPAGWPSFSGNTNRIPDRRPASEHGESVRGFRNAGQLRSWARGVVLLTDRAQYSTTTFLLNPALPWDFDLLLRSSVLSHGLVIS